MKNLVWVGTGRRWKIGSLSWAGGQRVASGRCSVHQLYHVAGRYTSSGMRHSVVEQEEQEKKKEEEKKGGGAGEGGGRPARHRLGPSATLPCVAALALIFRQFQLCL